MESLKEHAVPIISGLLVFAGIGFTIAGWFFRNLLKSIQDKMAELCRTVTELVGKCGRQQADCWRDFGDKITALATRDDVKALRDDFTEWKQQRRYIREEVKDELYTALDNHRHAPDGKVERG